MNILIGPKWRCYLQDSGNLQLLDDHKYQVSFSFEKGKFDNLLQALPSNWRPDLILLERPEYLSYPIGIENAECPVVAMVGDWNICFRVLQDNLRRFDWIVVDQKGVNIFKSAGYENVDYFPVYGFDPNVHQILPGYDRIYDVVMIGNFNHEFQRERTKWLKRLTQINPKYKVQILTNIFGDEYVQIYNQAKIIFNRSIRGEMNERAYEAPANGALLLYEEENLEIKKFLIPSEECVLYNENNFEELIEYYLTHDKEREQIAFAGYRKIQQFAYERQLCQLFELLEKRGVFRDRGKHRTFLKLSEAEQYYRNAKLALQEVTPNRMQIAKQMLKKAIELNPRHYEARNAQSMIYILYYEQEKTHKEKRQEYFDKSLNSYIDITEEIPNAGLVHYNIGCICHSIEQYELAEAEYKKAVEISKNNESLVVKDYFFPRDYVTFRIEWEKISALPGIGSKNQDADFKKLLRWQCCFLLGGLCLINHRVNEALDWYKQSVEARPDLAARARLKIGEILAVLGQHDSAQEEFEKTVDLEPFNTEAWQAYTKLLIKVEKYEECRNYINELLLLIDRCPFYMHEKKWLIPINEQISSKIRLQ